MCAYHINIEKETLINTNYRKVIHTVDGRYFNSGIQLVVMSIPPKQDIHREIHYNTTQFIRVEDGVGAVEIDDNYSGIDSKMNIIPLSTGEAIIIPPGTYHRVINTGKNPLKLYTIYTSTEHEKNLIQAKRPKDEQIS
jgi:mannose-6-phosphate isomerase-like protein (cupin superfamily)